LRGDDPGGRPALIFAIQPAARVDLHGDAGSMLTGLVVGVLAIESSLKSPATIALIAPLSLLTIPFFDTSAALLRRKLTGRSIYSTDRGHLHHCLMRRGFSTPVVLAVVSLFCGLSVVGGVASLALKNEIVAVGSTLTVVCVLVTTRLFGYAEFLLVRQHLSRLATSMLRTCQRPPMQLEVHLHGTGNWTALMAAVTGQAPSLGLQTVCLAVSDPALHEEYHAEWQWSRENVDAILWRAEAPLAISDRLLVSGFPDSEPMWSKVATLSRLIDDFQRSASTNEQMVSWRKDHLVTSAPGRPHWPMPAPEGEGEPPDGVDEEAMGRASQEIISRWSLDRFSGGLNRAVQAALASPGLPARPLTRLLLSFLTRTTLGRARE
jgi:hypothetical protein